MKERHLQQDFEGREFLIEEVIRKCYYCTFSSGHAHFWLRPTFKEQNQIKSICFVVTDKDKLEYLYDNVVTKSEIDVNYYGYLSITEY